ncbi:hypothetical protein [Microbulbifer thermotolerans]|uniref:Outer membrane protein beta-barrel domain-containing protein n=1 Tax=Microbulbifer thermotolerans TaxID=252514 RepID=A0A143HNQ2_MICTH|nr:hypothetical protein [Microbulbifer thermotolerans]AMX03364.1 hypothetical protein A3224_12930 [Microbulbifer thermotolerans]
MYKYKKLVLGLVLGAISTAAAAQEQVEEGAEYRGSWGISAEFINFNTDVATVNGIADSGIGLGGSYSGEKGLFNFTIGASLFYVDDKAEFSQRVQNSWTDDEYTEDSSIDAVSLYLDGGILYPLSEGVSLGMNVGYRYFDIDRSIANCSNCYSEEIQIESDTYLKPFARFTFNDRFSGTLAYFSYTGDKGAENSVQFEVNFNW